MWKDTKALLDDWDINMDPKAKLREYSLSDIQMLEIVKAVSKKAKIIIMDEPTSALGAKEVDKLFSAVCRLKEEGVGVVIITKGIDLSVGSIVALSSVLSASLVQDPNYVAKLLPRVDVLPAWIAFSVGLLAGVLVGAFSGYLVAYKKVPPFVATLGTQVIARGISFVYTNAYPVSNLSSEFRALGQGKIGGISYLVILLAFLCFITEIILHKTAFGKTLYAIGGNGNSAKTAGIRVKKNTMLASRSGAGSASLGTGYELDAIAAATMEV